jgi:hypothetical protein
MQIRMSHLILLSLLNCTYASAEMDTSRVFKDSKGSKFVMIANSVQSCLKGDERVNYTLFTPDLKNEIYGCALTYHYAAKDGNRGSYRTDKLIKYSRSNDDVCKNRLKKLLEKVKKLGFKCSFSGIG